MRNVREKSLLLRSQRIPLRNEHYYNVTLIIKVVVGVSAGRRPINL